MQRKKVRSILYGILVLSLLPLGLASCTARPLSFGPRYATFPPQAVMEHGNYRRFVTENQQTLEQCKRETVCATALFNLSFAYAYAQSPYYDPAKALQYLDILHKRHPQTPLAFQGQIWKAFLHEKLVLEEAQSRLQAGLRSREATIRNLQGRLKRSRDIDLQIEQKERELLR